jgi:hypothetical protein
MDFSRLTTIIIGFLCAALALAATAAVIGYFVWMRRRQGSGSDD